MEDGPVLFENKVCYVGGYVVLILIVMEDGLVLGLIRHY